MNTEESILRQIKPKNDDEHFMKEALKLAEKAFSEGEVPVGAVLVHNGEVIAKGYNQMELLKDATAHAEMICLTAGTSYYEDWRLQDSILYCTLEPCCMCAGAMFLARIKKLVYGAPDIRHGAAGSWINVFKEKHPTHQVEVESGVLEPYCADLMRRFFQMRREV